MQCPPRPGPGRNGMNPKGLVAALPQQGLESVPLDAETMDAYDVVVVVTAHEAVDWEMVGRDAELVVDLRNVVPGANGKVWRL